MGVPAEEEQEEEEEKKQKKEKQKKKKKKKKQKSYNRPMALKQGQGQIFTNIIVSAFLMFAQYEKSCFLQGHAMISATAKC